jgi:hypothetical protein
MRNILRATATVAVLALLAAVPAAAQMDLKPAVGITYSDYSKDPSTGTITGQVGYEVGGTVVIGAGPYLEGGVFYATKSVEYQEATTNTTFGNDLNGVRIPLMIGFSLIPVSEGSSLGLRVFGGGSAFIFTSASAQGMKLEDFNSPSWGVFAGAGVDIGMFFVDASYEWSLTEVSELSTVDVGQTRSLVATAGIRLSH